MVVASMCVTHFNISILTCCGKVCLMLILIVLDFLGGKGEKTCLFQQSWILYPRNSLNVLVVTKLTLKATFNRLGLLYKLMKASKPVY